MSERFIYKQASNASEPMLIEFIVSMEAINYICCGDKRADSNDSGRVITGDHPGTRVIDYSAR